ncbi:hypothetical protein [Spirosoma sp. KUDC1026]|uniref:hypothetical protein n=1 Tax=Spirosoma sp. KUDC1026 TaxID=2745947 RepID=UPI00159B9E1D|nr:hypothetical protein [Spirosoma sp. KUDC1026]QKZ13451.1 hypothetical protein HU175_12725 [Spirosoma sp. KUDC1026]
MPEYIAVTCFVAEQVDKVVFAGDLQQYSVEVANSILSRNEPLSRLKRDQACSIIENVKAEYSRLFDSNEITKDVKYVRENIVNSSKSERKITRAYGGYYLSYNQSLLIDLILESLPVDVELRCIMLASIIEATSQCVAAPGHTAQYFKPVGKGLDAIIDAWKRDPLVYYERNFDRIADRFAKTKGEAIVGEAGSLLNKVKEGDLERVGELRKLESRVNFVSTKT